MPDTPEETHGKASPTYDKNAYAFMSQALDYTLNAIGRRRHIAGAELLKGVRAFGLQQFGFLARTVFETWGIHRTDDFGRIVFELIESGKMTKTPQDNIADFHEVYDFAEAFDDFDALDFSIDALAPDGTQEL